ncbi:uncharacterized protein LOC129270603 [Lytechinus pictus]|uniref:uncharacterized protein LOC129270603 n=1 Tax=Lytechinus pictus TaxID=7653 RepID=UPI0030B9B8A9
MALELPFNNWPFSSANSGRPGQQHQQKTFKRYDRNESPFKDISPIPTGRDFGTFPIVDRQPKNVARKEATQNLNIRASRGFLAPEELTPENQFHPIPENDDVTRHNPLHEPAGVQQESEVQPETRTKEPWRGLSLMDRYRDSKRKPKPVRRTNSLLEFSEFIFQREDGTTVQPGQNPPRHFPSPTQRRRQPPAMTEQQALKRMDLQQQLAYHLHNIDTGRHPNSDIIGGQLYSSGRRQANGGLEPNQRNGLENGIQQPRVVPTLIPTAQPINYQPFDDIPYLPRKTRRTEFQRKEKKILCCGISLVLTGLILSCGFIAIFVAITVLNDAWPNSGLVLVGVVFGLLVMVVGFIFACHSCFFTEKEEVDTPAHVSSYHPVWQHSLQRSTIDRQGASDAIPVTDLPLVGDTYNEQPLEPEVIVTDGNVGETVLPSMPNGSVPVSNGVPTPLAFAAPFSTSANDYHMY